MNQMQCPHALFSAAACHCWDVHILGESMSALQLKAATRLSVIKKMQTKIAYVCRAAICKEAANGSRYERQGALTRCV